ncbi:MAG: geranylgeranylglycerol-phosphate geranylgeranyltransferase [Bacteroidales bacterium]|nr:geranylgeranylglycerol-phosphate geranylgeranyltransferase [Bacteroidales bacterium]
MLTYSKLFRLPNLLITALAMVLVRYCLIRPVFQEGGIALQLPLYLFVLLVLSVLFIAAAGYAINDYFDIRIDRLNKPKKIVLGRKVPIRKAILYHSLFNVIGVALGFYIAIQVGNFKLGFIHAFASLWLWGYSSRFKRTPLWGNVIIAFSAALTIFIVWLFEYFAMVKNVQFIPPIYLSEIFRLTLTMTVFAFVINLIREIIKDIEDVPGDKRYGCRTLPVAIGINNTRLVALILTLLLMIGVAFIQYYLFSVVGKLIFYYFFIIHFLLVYLIIILVKASQKEDYSFASQLARVVIIAGILAMQIYYISLP